MWGRRRARKPRLFSVVTIFVVVHPTKRADLSRARLQGGVNSRTRFARFLTTQAEHPNTQEWGQRQAAVQKPFGSLLHRKGSELADASGASNYWES